MKSFIKFLHSTTSLQRKAIMKSLTNDQLKLLIEIVYNVAMNVIPILEEDKRLLSKHKLSIRRTLEEGISKKQRQQRLLTIHKILPIFIRNYLKWQES